MLPDAPSPWTRIIADLVHPFEAPSIEHPPVSMPAPGQGQGEEVDDPQLLATIEQLCAVLGVRRPRVLASAQPGHAYGPGTLRLSTTALADYAPRDREALLAHCCGHLLLPQAGELSADRVAALYQGSADAITRVIFSEAVHSGAIDPDPAVRVREIQAWTATTGFARLVTTVTTAVRSPSSAR